jgi:hypothetical protein
MFLKLSSYIITKTPIDPLFRISQRGNSPCTDTLTGAVFGFWRMIGARKYPLLFARLGV